MTRRSGSKWCLVGVAIVWAVEAIAAANPVTRPLTVSPSLRIQQKANTLSVQQLQGGAWHQIKKLDGLASVGLKPGPDGRSTNALFYDKTGNLIGQSKSGTVHWDGGSVRSESGKMKLEHLTSKQSVDRVVLFAPDSIKLGLGEQTSPRPNTEAGSDSGSRARPAEPTSPKPSEESVSRDIGKLGSALTVACIAVKSSKDDKNLDKDVKNRTGRKSASEEACDAPKKLAQEAWIKMVK